MDDLRRRFRRLDQMTAPDLWYDAVHRAADAQAAHRTTFNSSLALIAAALLLAALAGTVAVGAWLDRRSPPSIEDVVTYENGVLVASLECGRVVSMDPTSFARRVLVAGTEGCEPSDDGLGLFGWSMWSAWSRDGTRLAYFVPPTAEAQAVTGVWVYEAATGDTWQVCPGSRCGDAAISPDGSLVAHVECCDEEGGSGQAVVVVTGVDTAREYRIELPPASPRSVAFSPDGSRIAVAMFGGRSGVYVVDIGGLADGVIGEATLVHGIVDASHLVWSPDGEWIAMTQSGGLGEAGNVISTPLNQQIQLAGTGIVVVRADGSETRILATGPAEHGPSLPAWSPDSESIAYVTDSERGLGRFTVELWTVDIQAGEPALIYESECCVDGWQRPAWSPDGEWLSIGVDVPDDPARSGLVLVRPDGSDVRYATDWPFEPVWQPIPAD